MGGGGAREPTRTAQRGQEYFGHPVPSLSFGAHTFDSPTRASVFVIGGNNCKKKKEIIMPRVGVYATVLPGIPPHTPAAPLVYSSFTHS